MRAEQFEFESDVRAFFIPEGIHGPDLKKDISLRDEILDAEASANSCTSVSGNSHLKSSRDGLGDPVGRVEATHDGVIVRPRRGSLHLLRPGPQ